jgi:Ca2+/Na+ antiporter
MKKKKNTKSYKMNSLIFLFVLIVFVLFPKIFYFYRQSYQTIIIVAWILVAGVFIYLINRAKFPRNKDRKKDNAK